MRGGRAAGAATHHCGPVAATWRCKPSACACACRGGRGQLRRPAGGRGAELQRIPRPFTRAAPVPVLCTEHAVSGASQVEVSQSVGRGGGHAGSCAWDTTTSAAFSSCTGFGPKGTGYLSTPCVQLHASVHQPFCCPPIKAQGAGGGRSSCWKLPPFLGPCAGLGEASNGVPFLPPLPWRCGCHHAPPPPRPKQPHLQAAQLPPAARRRCSCPPRPHAPSHLGRRAGVGRGEQGKSSNGACAAPPARTHPGPVGLHPQPSPSRTPAPLAPPPRPPKH